MKLESLKMNLKSLKIRVNNEKAGHSREKTTKSATNLIQNKPNSPIVQMNASLFITMNYPIFASLTKVKNKPNQTQFKPKSNPIAKKPKMNLSTYFTSKYNNKTAFRLKLNKPNQTQFKANLEKAHISDIYQRNSLSLTSRRPIISCECYDHNEDITFRKQFLRDSLNY